MLLSKSLGKKMISQVVNKDHLSSVCEKAMYFWSKAFFCPKINTPHNEWSNTMHLCYLGQSLTVSDRDLKQLT